MEEKKIKTEIVTRTEAKVMKISEKRLP